jgi:hypothetical protein
MKKIIDTGYNKEKKQWWVEFVHDKKNYFIIWAEGTRDGQPTFDIGVFPASLKKESIDGPRKRTSRNKKTDESSTKKIT